MSLTERVSGLLDRHLSRRSFLVRSAFVGSALAAGGTDFLLRPGTAYGSMCGPPSCGGNCNCDSTCCIGYTEFCCVLDGGYNSCPDNTIAGGWWLAEGSEYCSGPRYYMDCNGTCDCNCEGASFCSNCDGLTCECAYGNCNNYRTGCYAFRYGQCNQDVACIGRIKCRVVTCTPPWEFEDCTHTSATDNGTANQNASCLTKNPTYPCDAPSTKCEVVSMALTRDGDGYGIATSYGKILGYGNEQAEQVNDLGEGTVTDFAMGPKQGSWVVTTKGRVCTINDAPFFGDARNDGLASNVIGMAPTPTGQGYWLLSARGKVLNYGDAQYLGEDDSSGYTNFVGIAATPTGLGYWLFRASGEVFAHGDAMFLGDVRGVSVELPWCGIAAAPDGYGYWLTNGGGRVHNFGTAPNHGGLGGDKLSYNIMGIAGTHTGEGYYLVAQDGGIYTFGDAKYYGDPVQK
ncbi:MAG TPA: hypothetical protein VKV25_08035 [Acidimicrobiales bacterium]|nr:hypothetical protein [Acidimicrobiales bacterium]